MRLCCVSTCKSKSSDSYISFHEIPSNITLRLKWLEVLSKEKVTDRTFVCSKHFKSSDYSKNHRLKKNVVPSVFLDSPTCNTSPQNRNIKRANELEISELNKKFKSNITEQDADKKSVKLSEAVLLSGSTEDAYLLLNFENSFGISEDSIQNRNSKESNVLNKTVVSSVNQNDVLVGQEQFEDKAVQTNLRANNLNNYTSEIKRLRNLLNYRNKEFCKLKNKVLSLNDKLRFYKKNVYFNNLEKMIALEEENLADNHTTFILNQLNNFNKKAPRWSENIVRECILLNAIAPEGYSALINRKLLKLPCKMTLNRYTSPITGDTDIIQLKVD